MIKAIKKLFSVDESELDFDEIETTDDKSTLYQDELNNKLENTGVTNYNKSIEDDNIIKEIDNDVDIIISEPNVQSIEETAPEIDILEANKVETKPNRRSFDFAKEIEDAYEKPYVPFEETEEVKEVETVKVDETKQTESSKSEDLVNKDNYVLKDIISPMRGVIRKETNTIKRDVDVKKAQIIKLREQIKTTEMEPNDEDYYETIEFPFTDTKDLEGDLNKIPFEEPRDTLSETSKFTLIEDSTGEMRLVIDEDE